MFLEINEMNTVAADYKIFELTDNDSSILQSCIIAAVKRVKSYLISRYDVTAIFTKTGDERDPDILEITKNVALWYLVRRNNIDILYNRVKEIYDRDIVYLKALASGDISSDLPKATAENGETVSSFRMGSNAKFRHSW